MPHTPSSSNSSSSTPPSSSSSPGGLIGRQPPAVTIEEYKMFVIDGAKNYLVAVDYSNSFVIKDLLHGLGFRYYKSEERLKIFKKAGLTTCPGHFARKNSLWLKNVICEDLEDLEIASNELNRMMTQVNQLNNAIVDTPNGNRVIHFTSQSVQSGLTLQQGLIAMKAARESMEFGEVIDDSIPMNMKL